MVIVFDLDDTLYDEIEFVGSGFRVVAEHLEPDRCDEIDAYMHMRFAENGSGRVFDDTLAHFRLPHRASALVDLYRNHRPSITMPADRAAVLAELHARVASFSLVSDGPYITQRNKFERLGLRAVIPQPVFTAQLGAPKPAPAAFEAVMRGHEAERDFVYVADNPKKDFIAPRALGWRTIRFRNPRGIYRDAEGESDVEIVDFAQLLLAV